MNEEVALFYKSVWEGWEVVSCKPMISYNGAFLVELAYEGYRGTGAIKKFIVLGASPEQYLAEFSRYLDMMYGEICEK